MPYYVLEGGKPVGPFEAAALAGRPGVTGASMVCVAGATSADAWKPASSFADIAALLAPPAPPPPPPPPPAAGGAFRSEMTIELPPGSLELPKAAPDPTLGSPADKLILVVDDDDAVRSFLEMGATMQGFKVLEASNGIEAQAKLALQKPDLIITDLMMPGQGGYEFLRTLTGGASKKTPVFVVTGSTLDQSTIALIKGEANVVEFINKPVKLDVFVKLLHKHLHTAPKA